MTLFDQISEDIKSAMKARDKVRLETLRNIKKLMVLALLMSMVSTKMMAYDAKIKGLYYSFSGTEAEIVTEFDNGYDNPPTASNIVIPSTVEYNGKTYTVTSIGDYVFYYNERLRTITIPNTIVNIGNCAFCGAEKLRSIHIPKSVTTIGEAAFACDLESLTVDPENAVFDSRDNCNAVIETATNTLVAVCNSTVIPSSVTTIGRYAFKYAKVHANIIPYGVTAIGELAFVDSYSYDNTIILPNSIKTIGISAFGGCSYLKSVIIPSSVESIGNNAFWTRCYNSSITFDNCVPDFNYRDILKAIIDYDYTTDVYYPAYAHSIFSVGYMRHCTLHPQIKINDEWTSYCASASFDVPEGIDAYVVKSYEEGVVTLQKVTTINEGQGVLLRPANVGTFYDATLCTETPDAYESNMLKGVTAATDIAETDGEYTNFIFNIVDDKIGFYPANAGTIPAYQAYLQIPTASLSTSTPARLEIVFEDGDLSNVKQFKTNTVTDGNWYMLDGALTPKPSKQGVYIYNGKKVIIK